MNAVHLYMKPNESDVYASSSSSTSSGGSPWGHEARRPEDGQSDRHGKVSWSGGGVYARGEKMFSLHFTVYIRTAVVVGFDRVLASPCIVFIIGSAPLPPFAQFFFLFCFFFLSIVIMGHGGRRMGGGGWEMCVQK